jgi:hypothetical protein
MDAGQLSWCRRGRASFVTHASRKRQEEALDPRLSILPKQKSNVSDISKKKRRVAINQPTHLQLLHFILQFFDW